MGVQVWFNSILCTFNLLSNPTTAGRNLQSSAYVFIASSLARALALL